MRWYLLATGLILLWWNRGNYNNFRAQSLTLTRIFLMGKQWVSIRMQATSLWGKLVKKQPELCLFDMQHCFIYKARLQVQGGDLEIECRLHIQWESEGVSHLIETQGTWRGWEHQVLRDLRNPREWRSQAVFWKRSAQARECVKKEAPHCVLHVTAIIDSK